MKIETERILIRDFKQEDVFDLHEILKDEEVMCQCEPPYTFEKTAEFLSSFCIAKGNAFAAQNKSTGKVIGNILFHPLEPSIYEIGWFFNKSVWRQGYAYESCKALIDYAFCSGIAVRIEAETIDETKSAGLMKKLGMHLEKIIPDCACDNDGNRKDLYLYSISPAYE